jgi:hypothetical protein
MFEERAAGQSAERHPVEFKTACTLAGDTDTLVRTGGNPMAVEVVGKLARVTAVITPDHLGEVVIEVRAGTERFMARSADKDATIPKHTQVLVVGSLGGRTVEVAPADSMRLPR